MIKSNPVLIYWLVLTLYGDIVVESKVAGIFYYSIIIISSPPVAQKI